jgi:hypothetical protein
MFRENPAFFRVREVIKSGTLFVISFVYTIF